MPFVKLDTQILDSTLWEGRDPRDVFVTALLMAQPREFDQPQKQIEVDGLGLTGFEAPPGWYGFVPASGPGIVRRALVPHEEGMTALVKLGEPDPESRSHDFEGRRMIRVDGGYLILNYMKYRDKDHTAAERMRRYRARKAAPVVTGNDCTTTRNNTVTRRNVTQAEAEAEAKKNNPPTPLPGGNGSERALKVMGDEQRDRFVAFWALYPKREGKLDAIKAWMKIRPDQAMHEQILAAVASAKKTPQWTKDGGQFIPHPATWLNGLRWEDEVQPARQDQGRLFPPKHEDDGQEVIL